MGIHISGTEVNTILMSYIDNETGMSISGMWLRLRCAKRVTTQNPQGGHIFGVPFFQVLGENTEGHAQGITEEALC